MKNELVKLPSKNRQRKMEMFNTHRRDILNFDNYMDLKKPGFGGPNSVIAQRDAKGNKINKDPKLKDYTRVVDRHPAFSHPVADPTYKAMTHDLVYKQEKKKPFTYNTATGIPVVEVGEVEETNEGFAYSSFASFINENDSEIEQLRAELEAYEDEHGGEEFEEEIGANPSGETRWQDSDGDGEWYEDEDVSAGANPLAELDEEPPAELADWFASLHGEEAEHEDPMAMQEDPMDNSDYSEFGANPFLDDEEEYYGEEFDEPLTSPEEDPAY
jgi:hypothetical protein